MLTNKGETYGEGNNAFCSIPYTCQRTRDEARPNVALRAVVSRPTCGRTSSRVR